MVDESIFPVVIAGLSEKKEEKELKPLKYGHGESYLECLGQIKESQIYKQRLTYFGHLMKANSLENNIGKRRKSCNELARRGKEGRSLDELQVMDTNRPNWRIFVHVVTKNHPIVLIKELYTEHNMGILIDPQTTKGVRQGCILSSYLVNLYTEHIMRLTDLDKI
ncbi:hypothetical protein LAZ67_19001410 [Cordylochernes scorpioides]|uniref:Reverse transcriptase n=1 Tax=Cordylochernes scorpioides TaxID=51811 RepID=A0ABY6LJU4_9ARAC|nr:hypothetical protein LAZ67_19001410 [Cordylochernes scorpioides]